MAAFPQFVFYRSLISTFTWRRIYNLIIVETGFLISRIFRQPIVLGKPWAASIEPTTSCNLRCPECPTGLQILKRSKGNLQIDAYNQILEKLSPNLMHLTLYFQGEPMLNPYFAQMVKQARSRDIFVATSTNGHFLDDTNVDLILKSGLNHLIVSLDGLDEVTYQTYRIRGNLKTVTEGLQRLISAKNHTKSQLPYVELQFIVMRHNQHQIQQMKEFAKTIGVDKLAFKTAQVYHFDSDDTIIPTIKEKSRYKRNEANGSWVIAAKIRNRCHRIWASIVVTWDGRVVPCCYDKDADFQMGNLLVDSLDNIWKNLQYSAFRNKVLTHRKDTDICRNCGE